MNTCLKTLAACAMAAALSASHTVRADVRQAQDYLTGNGTAGPYPLSWKLICSGDGTVTLDGTTLQWGADYSLDTDAGTITFTHPLPPTEAAVVRYDYDTATAQAQGAGPVVPLSLALNPHLSLDGAFDRPAGTPTGAGGLDFALNGGWQNAHGGALTTHLLFLPALTGSDARVAPNGMARIGLAIGGRTDLSRSVLLDFGLSRGGSGLGGAGGGEWTAGRQNLTLGGTFTPNQRMQATVGYLQSDPTSAGAQPTRSLTANASLKPTSGSELDAAFADTASPTVGGDTHNLDIKAAVTVGPSLSLSAESDESAAGANGVTQTLHAGATLKPTDHATLGAVFSRIAAPNQTGDDQTFDLDAALSPNKAVQFSTNVAVCQSASASSQAATVAGTAQPNRFIQFSGGYTWRTATLLPAATPQAEDSSNARITLAPLAAFQLVGTYDQNPSDGGGGVQRQADHGLSLQTSLGALSLDGGYTWSRQYAANATATGLQIGVGLRFSSNTQLTGDYRHCLTDSATPGGTNAYTVGLTRKLGDAFDLSLDGTMQQAVEATSGTPHTITASASLGMKF